MFVETDVNQTVVSSDRMSPFLSLNNGMFEQHFQFALHDRECVDVFLFHAVLKTSKNLLSLIL